MKLISCHMRKQLIACSLALICVIIVITSCNKLLPGLPESSEVLAEPIGSLTPDQLALHIIGDVEFARVFGTNDGLGPIFVQNSCESCHVGDGKGNPFNNLTRFGNYDSLGNWDPLLNMGGPQLQHRAILNYSPEVLPTGVASSQFLAPNVTGLGYLAAVTDATILSLVDSLDSDGNGISGTVNFVNAPSWLIPDPRYHEVQSGGTYIGRFGRKSSAIDLTMQTVGAYKQDMGVTSDYDPVDPVNYASSVFANDNVIDPEIPGSTVDKVVFYLQTLEAPRRRNETDPAVINGETLFISAGCADCHTPSLTTGPSEVEALNYVTFYPYTDMLMHDMGSELDDNYTEGSVLTSEWRTTPLWGLGLQMDSQGGQVYYLHDGRATTIDEAIQYHGGEAAPSRANFNALSEADKEKIRTFLMSL